MITVNDDIQLDENELSFQFVRAGGPGGQHVNKVATAVQVRFDVRNSPSLPEDVRERLQRIARKKINDDGVLVIEARRHRSQLRNREDAVERLVTLVRRATEKPKKRRRTRPTAQSKRRRLSDKKKRGDVKSGRKRVTPDE